MEEQIPQMKKLQQTMSDSGQLPLKHKIARRVKNTATLLLVILLLAGCSASKIAVRGSMLLMDGAKEAMNSEPDL